MEQIEVISWKTLDALKAVATHVEGIVGDLDTNEQMAVFCQIEEDYLELYYSELEGNYIRHYDDEDELLKEYTQRKHDFGEDDFDNDEYYDDDDAYEDDAEDDYTGYKIRDEEGEDDF